MTTETLDKLYLEWSQFTLARTSREIEFGHAAGLFDILHKVALERGHKAFPDESPFDFLQRLVVRP